MQTELLYVAGDNDIVMTNFLKEVEMLDHIEWEHNLLCLSYKDIIHVLGEDNEMIDSRACDNASVSSFSPRSMSSPCSSKAVDELDISSFSAKSDVSSLSLSSSVSSPASCESIIGEAMIDNEISVSDITVDIESSSSVVNKQSSKDFTAPAKHQEPYMEMIAKAMMLSRDHVVLLSEIYEYIQKNHQEMTRSKKSWRNSVRHNLSVNECFIKAKRAPTGRGFYWTVHSACFKSFQNGNYQRRDAVREVLRQNNHKTNRSLNPALRRPSHTKCSHLIPSTPNPISSHQQDPSYMMTYQGYYPTSSVGASPTYSDYNSTPSIGSTVYNNGTPYLPQLYPGTHNGLPNYQQSTVVW